MLENPFLTVKEETSVKLLRLSVVVNIVETIDQELCKEMIDRVSRGY